MSNSSSFCDANVVALSCTLIFWCVPKKGQASVLKNPGQEASGGKELGEGDRNNTSEDKDRPGVVCWETQYRTAADEIDWRGEKPDSSKSRAK